MATKKAFSLSRELFDKVSKRFPLHTCTETIGASGDPVLFLTIGGAGAANLVIRIVPIDWHVGVDAIGHAAQEYAQHEVQVASEKDAGAGLNFLTAQQTLNVFVEALKLGAKTKWFQSQTGTVPLETTLTLAQAGSALMATVLPDMYQPWSGA